MTEQAWTGIYGFGVLLTLVGVGVPVGIAMGWWIWWAMAAARRNTRFKHPRHYGFESIRFGKLVVVPLF